MLERIDNDPWLTAFTALGVVVAIRLIILFVAFIGREIFLDKLASDCYDDTLTDRDIWYRYIHQIFTHDTVDRRLILQTIRVMRKWKRYHLASLIFKQHKKLVKDALTVNQRAIEKVSHCP